ncbi:MAG: hypothetical protein ACLU41_00790 [Anaerotignum lactatifermentans]
MDKRDKCFVITPIGDKLDPIRRHIDGIIEAVIKPALGDKYEVIVSHRINEPGTITRQIIREIFEDKLVIVNLTERNPNVMYELAFRHCLGKPVILIAEQGTGLPSDIISERTIFYTNDAKGTLELKDELIKAESKIDFEKITSPIYDMLKEIDQEINILNSMESLTVGNKNDKDRLKYIFDRLGRIENMIAKNESNLRDEETEKNLVIYNFMVEGNAEELRKLKYEMLEKFSLDVYTFRKHGLKFFNVIVNGNIITVYCNGSASNSVLNELGMELVELLTHVTKQKVTLKNIIF